MQKSIFLQFLGTGSQRSTLSRATQSIALIIRNGKDVGEWLFDCGELTTHQIYSLQRQTKNVIDSARKNTILVKTPRISKIFITHMHGDHIYGLPTLLTDIGLSRIHNSAQSYSPIDIYGPPGLSDYLKTVFQLTDTKSNFPCIVHELYSSQDDPRLNDLSSGKLQYKDKRIAVDPIFPTTEGFWELFNNEFGQVKASHIHHTIECFGFAYQSNTSRKLNSEKITDILQQNTAVLQQYQLETGDIWRLLNNHQVVTLPNGISINPNDPSFTYMNEPPKTIAILGDTDNAREMKPLIMNADLLVHEATVIPSKAEKERKSEKEIETTVRYSGHSTTRMAAQFARECNVKKLVLSHISTRYPSNTPRFTSPEMKEMYEIAIKEFQNENVIIANDFMRVSL